jgi:hypothetical protein
MTTDEVSTLIGAMSPVTVAQGEASARRLISPKKKKLHVKPSR